MLIKWSGSEAISINPKNNQERVTMYPGNVLNVKDEVYDQLKNQYPESIEIADDADRTQVATIIVTQEELLQLNSVPKQLILAQGIDTAIMVQKVIASIDFNSVVYATNTDLEFRYDDVAVGDAAGAVVTANKISAIMVSAVNKQCLINGHGSTETNLMLNKGVSLIVPVGDPTAGDSDITITVYYKVLSI